MPETTNTSPDARQTAVPETTSAHRGQLMLFQPEPWVFDSRVVLACSISQIVEITPSSSTQTVRDAAPHVLGWTTWRDRPLIVVDISFSLSVGTPMLSATPSSSRIAAKPRPNRERSI